MFKVLLLWPSLTNVYVWEQMIFLLLYFIGLMNVQTPNLDDGTNDKFGAQAIEETDLSVFLTYEFVRT